MFERIVIGVEESPESLVALRQAARLLEPDGRLVLTAVADVALAVDSGCGQSEIGVRVGNSEWSQRQLA